MVLFKKENESEYINRKNHHPKNSTCIHGKVTLNRLCYLKEEDARLEAKEAKDTDKSAAFLQ